jgi:hypothetical protein
MMIWSTFCDIFYIAFIAKTSVGTREQTWISLACKSKETGGSLGYAERAAVEARCCCEWYASGAA